MTKVIGVRFRQAGKIYFFSPGKFHVKQGDKVAKIAEKYGVTIAQIKKWNNIPDINKVKIGQKLKIYPQK